MVSDPSKIQTKSEEDEMVGGLASSTSGADSFNPKSKKKIVLMMDDILKVGGGGGGGGARRRRNTQVTPVQLKTPQEVMKIKTWKYMVHWNRILLFWEYSYFHRISTYEEHCDRLEVDG